MSHNILVTGPPRIGKTTVIRSVVDRLDAHGYRVGGILSPERRANDTRIGFDIEDIMTGADNRMARTSGIEGPSVGKYRVDVAAIDAIAGPAIERALDDADVIVIDEIAPMEIFSTVFRTAVEQAFDDPIPTVATIHYRSSTGFIGDVKSRPDVEQFEVSVENRDELPSRIEERVRTWLSE